MAWIIVRAQAPDRYWTGRAWTPHIELAKAYAYRGDPLQESLRLGAKVRFYGYGAHPGAIRRQ